MFAIDGKARFHKTYEGDALWAASQEPCVMRLYLTCIASDCFGSRFEWLKAHRLSINSFKKAKKILEKAKLFEFKPEYGILPSGKHGVVGWLVRKLLNRNLEASNTTDNTSQSQILTFKPRPESTFDIGDTPVDYHRSSFDDDQPSFDDDDQLLTINHEKTLVNQPFQSRLDLNLDLNLDNLDLHRSNNKKKIEERTNPSEDISTIQDLSNRAHAYMSNDRDAAQEKIDYPSQNELESAYELTYDQTGIDYLQKPVEVKIEPNGETFNYEYCLNAKDSNADPKIYEYTDEETEKDRQTLNALIERRLASERSNFDGQKLTENRESNFDGHSITENASFVNSEDELNWFQDIDPATVLITDNFDWINYPINYFPENDTFKDAANEYRRVVDFSEAIGTDTSNPYFIRAIEYLRNRMKKLYLEEVSSKYPDFWDTPVYFELKGWTNQINDLGIKFIFGRHMLNFLEPIQSDIENLSRAFGRDKLICQLLLDDESNTEALIMLKEMYAEIWTDMRNIDKRRDTNTADITISEDWED